MKKRVGIVLSLLGLTLLVMVLASCSGGSRTSVQEVSKQGASVVAFNDEGKADQVLTNQLRIEEKNLPNGRDITVRAEGVVDLRNSYVEFKYNPSEEHPVNIEMGSLMNSASAPCLQQGFLNHTGVVPVAQVIVGGYANAGVTGSGELFTVTLANGPADRSISAYNQPITDPIVQGGAFDKGTKTVKWTNVFRADCDAKGKVDFADFGIIGAQYNKVVATTPAVEVADADNKGKVDFADFGVVGAQYNKALDGWAFWYSASEFTTPPTTAPAATIKASETTTFTTSIGTRGFKEFAVETKNLTGYTSEGYLYVAPSDGTTNYPALGANIKLDDGPVPTAKNIVDLEVEFLNILTEATPKDGKATVLTTASLLDAATQTINLIKANDRFAVRLKSFIYEYTDEKDNTIKYETKYDVATGKSTEHHKIGEAWAPDTTKLVADLPAAYQGIQDKLNYTFGGTGVVSVGGATTFTNPIIGKNVEGRLADVFITMDATDTVTRTATVTVELPASLGISKTALKFTVTNTVGADPKAPVVTALTESTYGDLDQVLGFQINAEVAPDTTENEVVDTTRVVYISMVPWDSTNSQRDPNRNILVYKQNFDDKAFMAPNPKPDTHTVNPTGTELVDDIYNKEKFAIDGFSDFYHKPGEPTKIQFRVPLTWFKYYGTYRMRVWNGVYRSESGSKIYAHPSTILTPLDMKIGGLENIPSTVWPNSLTLDPTATATPTYPTMNFNPFKLIVYVSDPVLYQDGRMESGKFNMNWASPALEGIFVKGEIDGTTRKTLYGNQFFLAPTFPLVMVQKPGDTNFQVKDIVLERWKNRIALNIPKGDPAGTAEEQFWGVAGTYKIQFRQNALDTNAETIMINTEFTRTATTDLINYQRMPKIYSLGIYDDANPFKTAFDNKTAFTKFEVSTTEFTDSLNRYIIILGENFGPFVESGADREGNKATPTAMTHVYLASNSTGDDAVELERVMIERAESGTRDGTDGNQLTIPAIIKAYIPHDGSFTTGSFFITVTYGDDPTNANPNRHFFGSQAILIK